MAEQTQDMCRVSNELCQVLYRACWSIYSWCSGFLLQGYLCLLPIIHSVLMYGKTNTGNVQSFKWIVPGFVQSSVVDILLIYSLIYFWFLIWNWSFQVNTHETDPTSPDEIAVEDGGGAEVSVINGVRLIKELCHSVPIFWFLASRSPVSAATYI